MMTRGGGALICGAGNLVPQATYSLSHFAAEADQSAFAHFQRLGKFAADYERVAFVGLGVERSLAAALGAAFDVL